MTKAVDLCTCACLNMFIERRERAQRIQMEHVYGFIPES